MGRFKSTTDGNYKEPTQQPAEDDAYEDVLSSLMRNSARPTNSEQKAESGLLASLGRRAKSKNKKPQQKRPRDDRPNSPSSSSDPLIIDDEHRYRNSIFGPPRTTRQKKTKNKPTTVQVQLSINLKKPSLQPLRKFARNHRSQLLRVGTICLGLAVIVVGVGIFTGRNNSDNQASGDPAYIAPKTVFLPSPVPEGFTIGSSKQELENGAIIYGVYGPKGEELTITQQSEPANFKDEVFKDALRFNTPYGIGYVIEDVDRTTGFLLADDSWVLINTPRGFPSDEMRTLIRSLKPL